MYIQLEQHDYEAIAYLIDSEGNTEHGVVFYSEFDIEVKFSCQVDCHLIGDYESGYSETIIDDVDFELKSLDSGFATISYDEKELINTIERYLWRK